MNKQRYEFLISEIKTAGQMLVDAHKVGFKVSSKNNDVRDVLTETDLKVDQFLKGRIKETFPEDKIYSEESGDSIDSNGSFWSIDPIDGTSNFARGIPHFAVSLGYIENGVTVLGAVFNPMTNELYSFEKGVGAFLNGELIHVSKTGKLIDSTVLLHTGRPESVREWGLGLQREFLSSARKVINLGSTALDLCFIASGKVDAVIYGTFTTLDCAPAIGILREAGGEIYDTSGNIVELKKGPQKIIATSNRVLFEDILKTGKL